MNDQPPSEIREAVIDGFLENGMTLDLAERFAGALASSLERVAEKMAVGKMMAMASKLDGTPAGVALRRVLVPDNESLHQVEKRTGHSRKLLRYHQKQIEERLPELSIPPTW